MKLQYPDSVRRFNTFKKPIQTINTPLVHMDNKLICIDSAWTPVLRGALQALLDPIFWSGTVEEIDYSIQQINDLIEQTTMSNCDCIKHCLETNPDIINIIIDKQLGDPEQPLPEDILTDNWVEDLGCNNDALWGACQFVIDGVCDATTEVLQRIELSTSPAKAIAEALDDIPLLGFLTNAGALINMITSIGYDAWITADSEVVRDTLACELRCYAARDCAITFEHVEQVFLKRAKDFPIGTDSIDSLLLWLAQMVFSGQSALQVVSTMGMLGITVMKHGGTFGPWLFSIRTLETLVRTGYEFNPNPTWTTICSTCEYTMIETFDNEEGITWAFESNPEVGIVSYHLNEIGNDAPSIESIKTWIPSYGGYFWGSIVRITLPEAATVTSVEFDWRYTADNDKNVSRYAYCYDATDTLIASPIITDTQVRNSWTTEVFSAINAANVSYIVVGVTTSHPANTSEYRQTLLDNVKINYL